MKWDSSNLNAAHTMRELDEIPQPPYAGLGVGIEEPEKGSTFSGRLVAIILVSATIVVTLPFFIW